MRKIFGRALDLSSQASRGNPFIRSYIQRPGDGSTKNVTLFPGWGIGPEITASVEKIFNAVHTPVKFEREDCDNIENWEKVKRNRAILLGVRRGIQSTKYVDNIKFYKELGLYAHVVNAISIPEVPSRYNNVDIVIIRENTEGEYTGIEHEVYPGVMESLKIVTKQASLRIAEYAFEFALINGRKKVTAVHKANIMKLVDGMFLTACREVAARYPQIKFEEMIVDNTTMQLVKKPEQFDVMVSPNLYGTILANICAGICGGVGIIPGASVGQDHTLFCQGCRHTGADIAGKNLANPTAIIMSSVMMLRFLNLPHFADIISEGVRKTLVDGKMRTRDIGGTATTEAYTDEIIRNCLKFL